jgi:hypothetical protein
MLDSLEVGVGSSLGLGVVRRLLSETVTGGVTLVDCWLQMV